MAVLLTIPPVVTLPLPVVALPLPVVVMVVSVGRVVAPDHPLTGEIRVFSHPAAGSGMRILKTPQANRVSPSSLKKILSMPAIC
jgi:hypothetical protein